MATSYLKAPESGFIYGITQNVLILACASCGMIFGIAQDFEERRRQDHRAFYCPNGHANVFYGESDKERELREAKEAAARANAHLDQARARARRSEEISEERRRKLVSQKAATTRIKNQRDKMMKRIENGVCPCCTRSFKNVRQHMATQHPEALAKLKASD